MSGRVEDEWRDEHDLAEEGLRIGDKDLEGPYDRQCQNPPQSRHFGEAMEHEQAQGQERGTVEVGHTTDHADDVAAETVREPGQRCGPPVGNIPPGEALHTRGRERQVERQDPGQCNVARHEEEKPLGRIEDRRRPARNQRQSVEDPGVPEQRAAGLPGASHSCRDGQEVVHDIPAKQTAAFDRNSREQQQSDTDIDEIDNTQPEPPGGAFDRLWRHGVVRLLPICGHDPDTSPG